MEDNFNGDIFESWKFLEDTIAGNAEAVARAVEEIRGTQYALGNLLVLWAHPALEKLHCLTVFTFHRHIPILQTYGDGKTS